MSGSAYIHYYQVPHLCVYDMQHHSIPYHTTKCRTCVSTICSTIRYHTILPNAVHVPVCLYRRAGRQLQSKKLILLGPHFIAPTLIRHEALAIGGAFYFRRTRDVAVATRLPFTRANLW